MTGLFTDFHAFMRLLQICNTDYQNLAVNCAISRRIYLHFHIYGDAKKISFKCNLL